MKKCHFIFFGRLSKEKGADILLECLQKIVQSDRHEKLHVDIFGSGHYQKDYRKLSDKSSFIHYHGRQPFESIKKQLKKSDYSIMPSVFLETFGLSALESLSEGVPVIGIKKGGLTPFIINELSIGNENSSRTELLHNLYTIIKHCSTEKQKKQSGREKENKDKHRSEQAKQTAEQYNSKNRIIKFKKLSKRKTLNGKKILLVSDYKTKLGGIETYLYKVKDLLEEEEGASVKIIGANISKGKIGTLKRRALFFLSSYNIFFKHKLTNFIKKEKPDLIRYHSVLRHIGHQGIINKKDIPANSQTRLMYHDLGYLTAFPSDISSTSQIPKNLSRKEFFNKHKQTNTNNYQHQNGIKTCITSLALRHKHRLLNKLHKQIEKNIDLQLVPSNYLRAHIRNIHPTAKVEALSHFLEDG